MAVTYKKLWHLLIDRNLMKKDLEEMAGITHYQMCKLAKDKDVTTEVLGAVCKALDVHVEDIMVLCQNESQSFFTRHIKSNN